LDDAPVTELEATSANNPVIAAIIGGMDPQHAIVSGVAATPKDSLGVPGNARLLLQVEIC